MSKEYPVEVPRQLYVYDEVNGVFDLFEGSLAVDQPDQANLDDSRFSGLKKAAKVMGSFTLAACLTYGGVHIAGDMAGRKVASTGGAEVQPSVLWEDLTTNIPRRLGKGF